MGRMLEQTDSQGPPKTVRLCAEPGCSNPIPEHKRANARYCDEHSTQKARQARSRRRRGQTIIGTFPKAPPIGWECGDLDHPEPGSAEWCKVHGIAVDVLRARGVERYGTSDSDRERVKQAFREYLPEQRLGKISEVVGQSPGLLIPKHPLPGCEPIPPQLRPDTPVLTDRRATWHYHGPEPGVWPTFPPAGKRAGKPLVPVGQIAMRTREKIGEVQGADGTMLAVYPQRKTGAKFGYVIGEEEAKAHIERPSGCCS